MIEEYKGDLFKSDCNVIIHCCNCFNTMGVGIAKAIAKKYPEAKEVDQKTKKGDRKKLGSFTYIKAEDGTYVFNLYGQYNYGSKWINGSSDLDYAALEKGLKNIGAFLDKEKLWPFVKIGTYRIGCNRAGGDWSKVKAILERTLSKATLYVYEL